MTIPKVSQEARNAAADHQDHARGYACSAPLRDGRADNCSIVEAFAQFEQLIRSMVIDEAAGVEWYPRIGERVQVTEVVDGWQSWQELKLYVAGVGIHRDGLPGLEITVSEDWPRSSQSSGMTDDFWINRPFKPDMLRPVRASSIRQLWERGRG